MRGFETIGRGPQFTPPEPRIQLEEVDPKGRSELLRDPEVVAVTTIMPTRLIEPYVVLTQVQEAGVAWGIEAVRASESSFTGDGVLIAVLDTGIDKSHQAFEGVTLIERDFSNSGNGDRQGHGTHCAGTIFGRDVGDLRIGVARGVSRVLVGKVLPDDGFGNSEMLFQGMRWAMDQGAGVISMSLGFDFPGMVRDLTNNGWPADLATSSALGGLPRKPENVRRIDGHDPRKRGVRLGRGGSGGGGQRESARDQPGLRDCCFAASRCRRRHVGWRGC